MSQNTSQRMATSFLKGPLLLNPPASLLKCTKSEKGELKMISPSLPLWPGPHPLPFAIFHGHLHDHPNCFIAPFFCLGTSSLFWPDYLSGWFDLISWALPACKQSKVKTIYRNTLVKGRIITVPTTGFHRSQGKQFSLVRPVCRPPTLPCWWP